MPERVCFSAGFRRIGRKHFPQGNDMHRYRTHTCGALRERDIGAAVRLSGWCHRIRDHGGLLFIDVRDHYGLTQCVADPDSPAFAAAERLRAECVVRIDGTLRKRPEGTENPELPTGAVEIFIAEIEVLSPAAELPLPVFGEQEYPEDIRLKYRFLDLRRPARAHESAGFLRVPDADSDRILARGRPRLPGAFAAASWQILRAAAGAPAIQAAADGRGVRPVFPDRPVFSRRGPARRPPAG